MESTISGLLKRYETGGLTRRELVRCLAMLAAVATPVPMTAQIRSTPIRWAPLIDHIQINSGNPRTAATFYQEVMGLELLRTGPPGAEQNCCPDTEAFLGVGKKLILAIRKREPVGVVDHWSMRALGYTEDTLDAALKERGGEGAKHDLPGRYVRDPDGVLCQLTGGPAV